MEKVCVGLVPGCENACVCAHVCGAVILSLVVLVALV